MTRLVSNSNIKLHHFAGLLSSCFVYFEKNLIDSNLKLFQFKF